MLRRIDLRGRTPGTIEIRGLLPRAPVQVESALASVAPICDDVRARGALAVREVTKRFDGVDLETLRVPHDALATALADLDDTVRVALVEAARRARLVHEAQLHADVDIEVAPGGRVRERWVPVRRVGLYVPGGLVAYPSSVVMNVVPAQVAGVSSVALASPPQKGFDGAVHPTILAAGRNNGQPAPHQDRQTNWVAPIPVFPQKRAVSVLSKLRAFSLLKRCFGTWVW